MPNNNDGIKTTVGVKGDKEYKAALQQISRQLTVLNTDMKASQSAFGSQAETMGGLQDKLEKLNEIYEVQAKKVELIREQLEKAENAEDRNQRKIDELRIALNRATTQMNGTANQISDAKAGMETLAQAEQVAGKEIDTTNMTVKEAEKVLQESAKAAKDAAEAEEETGESAEDAAGGVDTFSDALEAVGSVASAISTGMGAALDVLGTIGDAAAAAIGEAFGLAKDAGKYADDLLTLSSQIGVDTDKLQQWQYASNFIDTSVDTITGSLTKLTKNMNDAQNGSESAQEKFVKLGVSWKDFDGNLRDSEDVFMDAIDALGQIKNPTERDALAMELFGKSAKELNPLIEAGSRAWRDMGKEAEAMGTVFSEENLAQMGAFDDSMQRFNATGQALANSLGLVVIPAFQPLVDAASNAMGGVSKALQEGVTPAEFEALMDQVLDDVEAALKETTGFIEENLPVAADMLSRVADALAEALPGLVKAVLPGAIRLVEGLGDALAENAESFAELAAAVLTALGTALVTALPKLLEKLPEIITGVWNGLTSENWPGLGGEILGKVMEGLGGFAEKAAEIFTGGRDEIAKIDWEGVKEKLGGVVAQLVNMTPEVLSAGLEGAYGIIKGLNWEALGETVGKITGALAGIAGEALAAPLQYAYGALSELNWSGMGENVGRITNALVGIEGEALAGPLETAYGIISGLDWNALGDSIADGLSRGFGLLAGVGDVALGLGEAAVGAGQQGVGALKDWIKSWRQDEEVENEATQVGTKVITDLDSGVKDEVPTLETTAKEAGDALLNAIKGVLTEEAVKAIGTDFDKNLGTGIEDGQPDVIVIVQTLADEAYSAMEQEVAAKNFSEIGRQMDAGIAQGVTNNSWLIEQAARDAALAAYYAACAALEVHSPSKKGDFLGEMFDLGLAGGIMDNADEVEDAVDFLNDLAAADVDDVNARVAVNGRPQGGSETDYDRIKAAFVEAIEETGLGDMVMAVDGRILGETVEPYSSRATRQRQQQTVKGRTSRLVMG